jgi:hypothetical protein
MYNVTGEDPISVSYINGKKHLGKLHSKVDSLDNLRDIGIA